MTQLPIVELLYTTLVALFVCLFYGWSVDSPVVETLFSLCAGACLGCLFGYLAYYDPEDDDLL